VRVHDASTERKTADNLLALLEDVVKEIEDKWGSYVVAVVTDASGECRKAKREFLKKYPWIVVLDCFSHQVSPFSQAYICINLIFNCPQVNLVVGDYFGVDSDILKYTDQATELITWLRSKTIVLGLLNQNQRETQGRVLTILRAMLTRWTSHLRAYERLNIVRPNLVSIAWADEGRSPADKLIVTGDAKAKAKSQSMIDLIKDNLFWFSLTRQVSLLGANHYSNTMNTNFQSHPPSPSPRNSSQCYSIVLLSIGYRSSHIWTLDRNLSDYDGC